MAWGPGAVATTSSGRHVDPRPYLPAARAAAALRLSQCAVMLCPVGSVATAALLLQYLAVVIGASILAFQMRQAGMAFVNMRRRRPTGIFAWLVSFGGVLTAQWGSEL